MSGNRQEKDSEADRRNDGVRKDPERESGSNRLGEKDTVAAKTLTDLRGYTIYSMMMSRIEIRPSFSSLYVHVLFFLIYLWKY